MSVAAGVPLPPLVTGPFMLKRHPVFNSWSAAQAELRSEWRKDAPFLTLEEASERLQDALRDGGDITTDAVRERVLDAGLWLSEPVPDECELHVDRVPVFLDPQGRVTPLTLAWDGAALLLPGTPQEETPS